MSLRRVSPKNLGWGSAYFCGGHKNNLRLQFLSSFKELGRTVTFMKYLFNISTKNFNLE